MRRTTQIIVILLLAPLFALRAGQAHRPNIVLILADDLGFETVGANGGTSYKTPVLDRLAESGARFTSCYAQPLCTPTRVQLMTGCSNARNYISFGKMDMEAVTFGNYFQNAGYVTCIAGKWQLGRDLNLPKKFGFNEYCLWQHTRRPPRYANPGLEINGVQKDFTGGQYGPDIVNDYALDFITRNRNRPFFLYYPMMLTHDPFQPTPDSKDWDPKAIGEEGNRKPSHFGEMVSYMDKLIGKLLSKLDEQGLRENTLVLFLGDNGTGNGVRSMMGDRVVFGRKGSTVDAGMHVPLIANWPGRIVKGTVCDDLVDTTDFLPTICEVASVKISESQKLDGRSFLPQLLGKKCRPRDWIYSWYSPRQGHSMKVIDFAFNHHYKLYRDGRFVDIVKDPEENNSLPVASLTGDAAQAAQLLQTALEQFKNARPAELH